MRMDAVHFDRMTRALGSGRSRRSLLAGLSVVALGLLPATLLPPTTAARKGKGKGKGKSKKKKPKQESACEEISKRCSGGRCYIGDACCNDLDCDSCTNSFCIGTPGRCGCLGNHGFLNGVCGEPPPCLPAGSIRGFYDWRCCSGIQHTEGPEEAPYEVCDPGYLSCLSNADCVGGLCRGFVCEAQSLECSRPV
jgi:hypothetical protein